MRYPHCKSCWWWKRIANTDDGICYYWRNKAKETSYCPDHINRREHNKKGKLEDYIEKYKSEIEIKMEE